MMMMMMMWGVHLRGVRISLVIYWGSEINKMKNPWKVVRGIIYFFGGGGGGGGGSQLLGPNFFMTFFSFRFRKI